MKSLPRLLRKLDLEEARREPDGYGGFATRWEKLGIQWAHISTRSGNETFIGGKVRPKVAYRIIIRATPFGSPSRPKPGQRFREGRRVFAILTVSEADPEGRYLEILAEEGSQL